MPIHFNKDAKAIQWNNGIARSKKKKQDKTGLLHHIQKITNSKWVVPQIAKAILRKNTELGEPGALTSGYTTELQ